MKSVILDFSSSGEGNCVVLVAVVLCHVQTNIEQRALWQRFV